MSLQEHRHGRHGRSDCGSPALTRETDLCAAELDDFRDRDELRQRYKRLLEETRVLLPGVQLFAAFLFTVPFTPRFDELDELGRRAYGVAIGAAILAVVLLTSPIAFHRVAERTARSARLVWGIRTTLAALALIAVALTAATLSVAGYVFGTVVGLLLTSGLAIAVLVCWVVLPFAYRHTGAARRVSRRRAALESRAGI